MSVFGAVDTASPSMGGNYLNDGHRYLLEIGLCKLAPSQKKPGVTNFIVEFRVHESDDQHYPSGSSASWVVDMSKFNAPGNVKWFVGAAKGIGPNEPRIREINQQVCDFVVSPANPLGPNAAQGRAHGAMVEVFCREEDTKPRPDGTRGKFTKHYWQPTQRPPVLPPDASIGQGRQFGQQQSYGSPQAGYPQPGQQSFPGAQQPQAAPPWAQPQAAPPWAQQPPPPAQQAAPPWAQPQQPQAAPPWGQPPLPPAQQGFPGAPPTYPQPGQQGFPGGQQPQAAPPWAQQPPPPAPNMQPQAAPPWGQPPLPPGYPQR